MAIDMYLLRSSAGGLSDSVFTGEWLSEYEGRRFLEMAVAQLYFHCSWLHKFPLYTS